MAETTQSLASPKISIIVPVYKVEQYLRRCLDSIALFLIEKRFGDEEK